MSDSPERPNPTWGALRGGIAHAFADPYTSTALCGSTFLRPTLLVPDDDTLKCLACTLKHGADLADASGIGMPDEDDTNPYPTGGNRVDL